MIERTKTYSKEVSGNMSSSRRRSSGALDSIVWLKTFCQDKESESGESWTAGSQVLKDEKSLSRPSERESGVEGDDERERCVPKVMAKDSLGQAVARVPGGFGCIRAYIKKPRRF